MICKDFETGRDHMNPKEPWLISSFRKIKTRPGAYLGTENVWALELFIAAYSQARTDLGFPQFGTGEENFLRDFGEWLEAKYELHDTRGWPSLVEKIDPSTKNVQSFFALFDEFLASG